MANEVNIELTVDQSGVGPAMRAFNAHMATQVKTLSALGGALVGGFGAQAAANLFGVYVDMVSKAVDHTVELNEALRSFDVGALTGRLGALNKELDRMGELSRLASEGGLAAPAAQVLLARQAFAETFLGQVRPEDEKKQVEARTKVAIGIQEANKQNALAVQAGQKEIASLQYKQQDELRRGNLAAAQETARDIAKATEHELTLAMQQLRVKQGGERAAAIQSLGTVTPEMERTFSAQQAAMEDDIKTRGERRALMAARAADALKVELLDVETMRQGLAADRAVQETEYVASAAKRDTDRTLSALSSLSAIQDAEHGLAKARADANDTILDDSRQVADQRRRIAEETAAAEVKGIEDATTGILRSLAIRRDQAQKELGGLGALTGLIPDAEMQRRKASLGAQVESFNAKIDEAAKVGAHQRAQREEQSAAELRKIEIREQQDKLGTLQATMRKEMELRLSVNATMRTLGLRTGTDDINEQFGLARAARPGSKQQADAFGAAAQGIAQRQGESRGAAGGILGAVRARLEAEGVTDASMADVQSAWADITQESRETVGDFRGGGSVDLATLQSSMGNLPLIEQAGKLGGVASIFGQAATPIADQFKAMSGDKGSAFDDMKNAASKPLGDVVTTFQEAFDRITAVIEESTARWAASVEKVVKPMATAIEAELVRGLDLARAKR